MSRFFVRIALSAGICSFLVGDTLAGDQETTARPLPSAGQQGILAALDQPTEFDFHQLPFSDAIDDFKRKHQIEIVLEGRALSDAGVVTDRLITEALKNVSLRSALRLLLDQLDLTYVLGDGYLLITSKTEAESKLNFKIYPVEDLVTLDSPFRPARIKRGDRDDSPVVNEVVFGPSVFGGLGAGPGRRDAAGDFQGLIDAITSTIAPTTWDEVGGPGAISANPNSQTIAISQTDDAHEEIAVLLAALRRVRDEQVAAAEPINPAPPDEPETSTRIQLRAYRLMRGTRAPGKSGWRPPEQFAGDVRQPRSKQTSDKAKEEPKPAGESGADKETPPAKVTETSKDAVAAESADPAVAGKPADAKLEALAEKIAELVPTLIEPESWKPSGEGMIRAVGEGVVVRHTEEVQRRVAWLMAELLPDCVPLGFNGPWGPWKAAFEAGRGALRLRAGTTVNWPHRAEPRPRGREALIHEALLETCDVQFDQLPLVDALRSLARPHQVQIFIDHKALTDAGVDTGTPITCSVKGLSYRAVLKLLLHELDLTYLIRDEVLFITSKTEAENMLPTKVYPVFDLVVRPVDAPAVRPVLDFQSLIDNITTSINPTTWDEVGGPGAVREFVNSGALVISQTTEVHEEIAEYLRALRETHVARASR